MKNMQQTYGSSRFTLFTLTFILIFSLPGFIRAEGCEGAIAIHEEPEEIIFEEGMEELWLYFEATSQEMSFNLEEIQLSNLYTLTLYEGSSCEELTVLSADTFLEDQEARIGKTYFTPERDYFIKISRDEMDGYGFPEVVMYADIINHLITNCPSLPFDQCNLIKNGNFTNSQSRNNASPGSLIWGEHLALMMSVIGRELHKLLI